MSCELASNNLTFLIIQDFDGKIIFVPDPLSSPQDTVLFWIVKAFTI